METNEIIRQCGIWIASIGGGAVVVNYIAKVILAIINLVIRKKPISLNAADREQISERVADIVSNNMQSGVSVDIDAQIDRATQNRLSLVENKTDEFIRSNNNLKNIVKKLAECIATLKSPDSEKKEALLKAVNEDANDIVATVNNENVKGIVKILNKHKKEEKVSY
jgi:hypothetical protein